tara:strand:- start:2922 stop:3311 length:390 start_codon:yes stop_codon:yes gene_type:complete
MAKMCLVNASGTIGEIVNPGQEYEIYEGEGAAIKWVNCSNDSVTIDWIMKAGVFVERSGPLVDFALRRKVAYGDIGAQLDMQYKDGLNGTTTWKDHIAAVKAANAAPSEQPDQEEITPNGTIENPAWES